MQNTYLFQLFRDFKLLFFMACGLIAGTLWFALKSHEEFPFLLFGMYSLKEESKEEYIAYSILAGGKEIVYDQLHDTEKELIETAAGNIVWQRDPITTTGFANWLRTHTGNKPVEIYRLTCIYTRQGQPLVKKRELVYPYDPY
jgi:hypothetical protein